MKPTAESVLELISQDPWMMEVLRLVRDLHLPDSWIGAGFVRNTVWDALHGYTNRTPLNDVDVVYYDLDYPEESFEKDAENKLRANRFEINWSVTNQARMHLVNGDRPYANTSEAIAKWPEVCTAVAVRMNDQEDLELLAPWGVEDLVNMVARPTPAFEKRLGDFAKRREEKQWEKKWPKVVFELPRQV